MMGILMDSVGGYEFEMLPVKMIVVAIVLIALIVSLIVVFIKINKRK